MHFLYLACRHRSEPPASLSKSTRLTVNFNDGSSDSHLFVDDDVVALPDWTTDRSTFRSNDEADIVALDRALDGSSACSSALFSRTFNAADRNHAVRLNVSGVIGSIGDSIVLTTRIFVQQQPSTPMTTAETSTPATTTLPLADRLKSTAIILVRTPVYAGVDSELAFVAKTLPPDCQLSVAFDDDDIGGGGGSSRAPQQSVEVYRTMADNLPPWIRTRQFCNVDVSVVDSTHDLTSSTVNRSRRHLSDGQQHAHCHRHRQRRDGDTCRPNSEFDAVDNLFVGLIGHRFEYDDVGIHHMTFHVSCSSSGGGHGSSVMIHAAVNVDIRPSLLDRLGGELFLLAPSVPVKVGTVVEFLILFVPRVNPSSSPPTDIYFSVDYGDGSTPTPATSLHSSLRSSLPAECAKMPGWVRRGRYVASHDHETVARIVDGSFDDDRHACAALTHVYSSEGWFQTTMSLTTAETNDTGAVASVGVRVDDDRKRTGLSDRLGPDSLLIALPRRRPVSNVPLNVVYAARNLVDALLVTIDFGDETPKSTFVVTMPPTFDDEVNPLTPPEATSGSEWSVTAVAGSESAESAQLHRQRTLWKTTHVYKKSGVYWIECRLTDEFDAVDADGAADVRVLRGRLDVRSNEEYEAEASEDLHMCI